MKSHPLSMPAAIAALLAVVVVFQADRAVAQSGIDLGELVGTYSPDQFGQNGFPAGRLFTTTVPSEVQAIDGITLVLSGFAHEGLVVCTDAVTGDPDSLAFVPGLTVHLWTDDPTAFFHATVAVDGGEFVDSVAVLEPCCGPGAPGFAGLLGSQVHGEFFLDAVFPLPCSPRSPDPVVVITSARLEISGTVPGERSGWGTIKALFR